MTNQGPGPPQDSNLSIVIALIIVVAATIGVLQISHAINLPGL
jgi:hypothetical protein